MEQYMKSLYRHPSQQDPPETKWREGEGKRQGPQQVLRNSEVTL